MSTIVASAGFGAICGSSIATAATFAKVAYPSMQRYGYKDALAAGAIAAGGTLGILIPPSVIMVIYGIMTETSIGKLFIAGIIPGSDRHRAAVPRRRRGSPGAIPRPARRPSRHSWAETLAASRKVWPVVLLFVLVIGGIYVGAFTAAEGRRHRRRRRVPVRAGRRRAEPARRSTRCWSTARARPRCCS